MTLGKFFMVWWLVGLVQPKLVEKKSTAKRELKKAVHMAQSCKLCLQPRLQGLSS